MASRKIGIGTARISPLQKKLVNEALDADRLSYGRLTAEFEQQFARLHGCRVGIFTNSGTSALQVALAALRITHGWGDGDEILVPAVTFVASANVVIQNNLKPIFVDVDPAYYELDPGRIEERITPRTRAIMPVHIAGLPCDMTAIMQIAERHGLRVIEDSCETMFAKVGDRPVGSFGDVACFSTYVAHLLVTGVGGLVTTNDSELGVLMKSLFNHGRDSIYIRIDDDKGASGQELFDIVSGRFNFVNVGYSYRATELEGALGLGELARHEELIAARRENARVLTDGLSDLQAAGRIQLPRIRSGATHSFMFYPIVVTDPDVHRDSLVFFLEENHIETRFLLPLINQPAYRRMFGDLDEDYPVASRLNSCAFYIGCHPFLTKGELSFVIDKVHEFFSRTSL